MRCGEGIRDQDQTVLVGRGVDQRNPRLDLSGATGAITDDDDGVPVHRLVRSRGEFDVLVVVGADLIDAELDDVDDRRGGRIVGEVPLQELVAAGVPVGAAIRSVGLQEVAGHGVEPAGDRFLAVRGVAVLGVVGAGSVRGGLVIGGEGADSPDPVRGIADVGVGGGEVPVRAHGDGAIGAVGVATAQPVDRTEVGVPGGRVEDAVVIGVEITVDGAPEVVDEEDGLGRHR